MASNKHITQNSTNVTKATLALYFAEQKQRDDISDADTPTIVHIMGGIESILEDYLSPNNDQLTPDQVYRLYNYLRTPQSIRQSANSKTAVTRSPFAKGDDLEDRIPSYNLEKEEYTFEAREILLRVCFSMNTIYKMYNILNHSFCKYVIFFSIVLFPVIAYFSFEYGLPLYVMCASVFVWIPYNLVWILSFNRRAFRYLIWNSFEFWIRFLYLFYIYCAAFYYYFRVKIYNEYEYPFFKKIELILLSICAFLALFVVTVFDIIKMSQTNKVFICFVVPIIPTFLWIAIQFVSLSNVTAFNHDSGRFNSVSLKSMMVNGLNVLSIILWKQWILTWNNRETEKCTIIKRNPIINWKEYLPSNVTHHTYSGSDDDGDDDDDVAVNTTAVFHKHITLDEGNNKEEDHDSISSMNSVTLSVDSPPSAKKQVITVEKADTATDGEGLGVIPVDDTPSDVKEDAKEVITMGDTVRLKETNALGIVRFIGNVENKSGIFYGIELNNKTHGKNNGSCDGVCYFKTENDSKSGVFTLYRKLEKVKENIDPNMPRVTVGDKVNVRLNVNNDRVATVRFIGNTLFRSGIWFGLEFSSPCGKHNGCINGRIYFKCKDKHGVIVRAGRVRGCFTIDKNGSV